MQSLLMYLGYIVYGIVFLFFKKIKKSANNDLKKNEHIKKLIYNKPEENKFKIYGNNYL